MDCDCDFLVERSGTKRDVAVHYSNCSSLLDGKNSKRNPDGTLKLPNNNLSKLEFDVLYHLGLDTQNYDLPAMFGDVKFVCLGGTKHRMREFASYLVNLLGLPQDTELVNLTKRSQRYATFKVGPVLSVSHGVGIPSMTTVLQEVIKLMYYAKARDPVFFRIGTSGGLGIPPGSVVVSSFGLSGKLEKSYEVPVLGEVRKWPSYLDKTLCDEVVSLVSDTKEFKTFVGGTMGADDFYRGQGRLDGPLCDYTEADKIAYLSKLTSLGVRNIEMEANAFAAITSEAGLRAGIVCVTLVNRLEGDQIRTPKETLTDWQKRPMIVVGLLIKKYVEKISKNK